ncbi:MAG: CAP domain-containing protein [Methyloceanibacter sp.]
MARLLVVASGLLVAAGLGHAGSARAQQFDLPPSARSMIVGETNAYRRQKGLPALSENDAASRVAQAYAAYLVETKKTGHGADGRSPRKRLTDAGIEVCKVWENWYGFWTRPKRASVSAAMMRAMRFWRGSPGHERALRSGSTEIGVGVAGWKHGEQWHYVEIQMFLDTSCLARPAPADAEGPPPLPDRNPERSQ